MKINTPLNLDQLVQKLQDPERAPRVYWIEPCLSWFPVNPLDGKESYPFDFREWISNVNSPDLTTGNRFITGDTVCSVILFQNDERITTCYRLRAEFHLNSNGMDIITTFETDRCRGTIRDHTTIIQDQVRGKSAEYGRMKLRDEYHWLIIGHRRWIDSYLEATVVPTSVVHLLDQITLRFNQLYKAIETKALFLDLDLEGVRQHQKNTHRWLNVASRVTWMQKNPQFMEGLQQFYVDLLTRGKVGCILDQIALIETFDNASNPETINKVLFEYYQVKMKILDDLLARTKPR